MVSNGNIKHTALQEIRSRINELRSIDLKTADIDFLKERLILLFKGYVITTPKVPQGWVVYRGVQYEDKPHRVIQLGYPPSHAIKKLQRVNRERHPMFYCSMAREAIPYELELKIGERAVISRWRTTHELMVNNVGYAEGVFGKFSSKRSRPRWRIRRHNKELKQENILIAEFFSEEFAKEVLDGQEHLYKLSIAIAEKHLEDDMFAGLLYPALAFHARADNFAFKPEFVDKYFVLEKVEYIKVDAREGDSQYRLTVLDRATSFTPDDKIQWKGPPRRWVIKEKGQRLIFTVEDGKWVARDGTGGIVEPEENA